MSRPENTFPGRVRRYAQVSGTMGGLAARLASARFLGLEIDQPQHAEQLRRALGSLKGPLMKVAQLLATIPEALPKEYAAELAQLQSAAPPMSRPFVRRRMAAELGPDWPSRFARFELEAAAAQTKTVDQPVRSVVRHTANANPRPSPDRRRRVSCRAQACAAGG